MNKEIIYTLDGLYRDPFQVEGFRFGQGNRSACIVGASRGNEIQQMYICSQIVQALKRLEEQGDIVNENEILVIPCMNPYSMNVGKRFWPSDNQDLNRSFPGKADGEVVSRISHAVLERVKGYNYGMQFTSFYMPGDFIPHVRMMETGYQSASLANLFGTPYVLIRKPKPIDTFTLNYNWQLSGTNAFSIYAGGLEEIDENAAKQAVSSVLRFLTRMGIIRYRNHSGYIASVIHDEDLMSVQANLAGLWKGCKKPGDVVEYGEVLGQILDPYEGHVKGEIVSPTQGIVFFAHNDPLIMENTEIYRIIRRMHE
ncbi:MAG: succinylglutamate desuccinylase/aspartoacylase family protein [Lachnospiraceae bacterium]|nr:succinylglutamate desuccinylase/aspartoacylase family protein [Lachnospiraceae bacterium]